MLKSKIQSKLSPNTDHRSINVEFLILHYTAASLKQTLEILTDPNKKVSSHFVIDTNGDIYELISACTPPALTAFHAGESEFKEDSKTWTQLNSCSIGVELVNLNGNLFKYPKPQYDTLVQLTQFLRELYPALKNGHRIMGHEHIAGFRGKVDPGHQFPWDQYFKDLQISPAPQRTPRLPLDIKERFEDFIQNLVDNEKDWATLNTMLEKQYKHHLDLDGDSN